MQRYRVVILIVLFGIVPVAIAFFVALSYLKGEAANPQAAVALPDATGEQAPPPVEPPETRKVLAAARALPFGSLIGDEDVAALEIDLAAVRKGHILAGDEEPAAALRGYAVRVPIASGEVVMRSAVVGPGQRGFLAAVLGPGARAVTIRVGPATSHAGLIDPGDRVDVILSAELETSSRDRSVLARTIVEDVRVVAVDRRVGNGAGAPDGDGSGSPDGAVAVRTEMITATLEVSPEQGDRLVLGEHEGKLSLAVRSLAAAVPRAVITAVDLQDLLLSPHEVEAAATAERLRREVDSLEERLRAEEQARKRLEEEERLRLEEEERLRVAEEERLRREDEERLRVAEAERARLAEELARLEAASRAAVPPTEEDAPPIQTVRVFRGSEPAQEVTFRE